MTPEAFRSAKLEDYGSLGAIASTFSSSTPSAQGNEIPSYPNTKTSDRGNATTAEPDVSGGVVQPRSAFLAVAKSVQAVARKDIPMPSSWAEVEHVLREHMAPAAPPLTEIPMSKFALQNVTHRRLEKNGNIGDLSIPDAVDEVSEYIEIDDPEFKDLVDGDDKEVDIGDVVNSGAVRRPGESISMYAARQFVERRSESREAPSHPADKEGKSETHFAGSEWQMSSEGQFSRVRRER